MAAACYLVLFGLDVDEMSVDQAAMAMTAGVLLEEHRRTIKTLNEKIPKLTK